MRSNKAVTLGVVCALSACDRDSDDESTARAQASATVAASASTPPASPSASPKGSASAAPAPPAKPLNVLLLTIDSLRQDMPWTGYERKIAPNLTELAEQSVVYTHAYSVSSYTAKSVGAMLSGRYPSSLYRSGWFFTGYSKDNLFFTEVLQEHGVRTLAGHGHMYFGRDKNLDQGFDVWEITPGITFDSTTDKHVTSDKMTALAKKLLGDPKNTQGQFFAWFHYMDPHDQYILHEESPEWGKSNRDRYDSEVFFTDLHVGKLLDWARKQSWWEHTAVIVSADHGEAFGEHDFYKHAFWLWDVITRVPLLVFAPEAEPKRIDVPRTQIDLAPTVLDLMGIDDVPEQFVGETLVPEIYGKKPAEERDVVVLDLPEDSHNPPVKAIVAGDYKLIAYGKWKKELYNLKEDPGETNDLSEKEPETFERMKKLFEETWADIPTVEPFGGMKLRGGGRATGPTGPPEPAAPGSAKPEASAAVPAPSAAASAK